MEFYVIAGLVILGLAAVYFNTRKSAKSNTAEDAPVQDVPYKVDPTPAVVPVAVEPEVVAPVEQKMQPEQVSTAEEKPKKPRAKKPAQPKTDDKVAKPKSPKASTKARKPKMTVVK